MKRIAALLIGTSLILMIILLTLKTKDIIVVDVFKIDNGFGYKIIYDQKTIIKQKNIPAIQQQKAFCSEKDALLIASLVKAKLENNLIPTIVLEDLKKLNIQIDCSK